MKTKTLFSIQWLLMVLTALALMASLKVSSAIVLPLVLSIFLAFLLSPIVQLLTRYKIPEPLAAIVALVVGAVVIGLLGWLVWSSLLTIEKSIPEYLVKLKALVHKVDEKAFGQGIQLKSYIPQLQQQLTGIIGAMANVLVNSAKNSLLIFFITMFVLLESTRFKQKSERAFGPKNKLTIAMVEIASEIKRYMLFKSLISLLTGFLVYISLKIAGVDFPLVWGILAFILNFIPSIGSIMASIPPVALALIQFPDPVQGVVMVGLILGVIQVSIGNFLDPKIMGNSLNISPLIIFLSMVFWGWLWGPMGMLIAVPLAVCIKVTASQIDKLKSLAIMMEGK